MKTPQELRKELSCIRTYAICGICDLVKEGEYVFKYGCGVAVEDDEGAFLQNIIRVEKEDGIITFVAEEEDPVLGEGRFEFGDFDTETIVSLYEHILFDINCKE